MDFDVLRHVNSSGAVGFGKPSASMRSLDIKMPECILNIFKYIATLFKRINPFKKQRDVPVPIALPIAPEAKPQPTAEEIERNSKLLAKLKAYKELEIKKLSLSILLGKAIEEDKRSWVSWGFSLLDIESDKIVALRKEIQDNAGQLEEASAAISEISEVDAKIRELEQFFIELAPSVGLSETPAALSQKEQFIQAIIEKAHSHAGTVFNALLGNGLEGNVTRVILTENSYRLELAQEIIVFVKDAEGTVEGALQRYGPVIEGELSCGKITFSKGVTVESKVRIGFGWISKEQIVTPTVNSFSFNASNEDVQITASYLGFSETKCRELTKMCEEFSKSEFATTETTYDKMVRRSFVSTE